MSEDQPANLLLHQRIQLESINRDMQIARSVKKILDCFSSILDPASIPVSIIISNLIPSFNIE